MDAGGPASITATDSASVAAEVVTAAVSVAAGGSTASISLTASVSVAENTIDNDVRAHVLDSSLDTGGALEVSALSNKDIDALGVSLAVDVSIGSGSLTLSGAVAVSQATNSISGVVEAVIEDANVADSQSVAAGGPITMLVDTTSTIDATLVVVAASVSVGSGAVTVSLSGAASLSDNTITSEARAGIDNSLVTTDSFLSIDAIANSQITANTVAVGISVAVGNTAAFSGAVGVASATNTISGSTEAVIEGASSVTAGGTVSLDLEDHAAIESNVVAAAISVSVSSSISGALGVSVALAENTIEGDSRAAIVGSTVTANGAFSDVTVDAATMNTIDAVAVAASVSVSASSGGLAFSGAGSGADARNVITNAVSAEIVGSDVTAGRAVDVELTDQSSITADTASVAASVSVSSGAAISGVVAITLAENQIGGTYRASIDDSEVDALGGGVAVTAFAQNSIDALALAIGISVSGSSGFAVGVGGTGVKATNILTNTLEASIVDSGVTADGLVDVDATDLSSIVSDIASATVSMSFSSSAAISFGISITEAENQIGSTTRATISGSTVDTTGGITVEALTDTDIDALGVMIGLSLGGSGGFSAGVSVAGLVARNITTSTTEASIVDSPSVQADGAVLVKARDLSSITSDIANVSASVGISSGVAVTLTINATIAENTIGGITMATIDGSSVSGSGLNVEALSQADIDALGVSVALSVTGSGGAAIGGAGTGIHALNTSTHETEASIKGGSTATFTGGNVAVKAEDKSVIFSDIANVAASVGFSSGAAVSLSIAATLAENAIDAVTTATVDGSTVTADQLDVTALSQTTIDALGATISFTATGSGGVSVSGAGSGVSAVNTIDSNTEASIRNGSVATIDGPVKVDAKDKSLITSDIATVAAALSFSGGAAVSLTVAATIAKNDFGGSTLASVDSSTVTASGLEVTALNEADIDALAVTIAVSVSGSGGFSMDGAGAGVEARNILSNTTEASIWDESTVNAGTSAVLVKAENKATILSDIATVSAALSFSGGGGASVAIAATIAENSIGGSTTATVDESTVTAGDLDVLATNDSTIDALAATISISVTAASGLAVGISGAGVESVNSTTNVTEASIRDGSIVTVNNGAVLVKAEDTSVITSDIANVSATIGISGGVAVNIAVAVTIAENSIGGGTSALIDDSTVTASTVEVNALNDSDIDALAATIAFSLGGSGAISVTGTGAGVEASNVTTNTTQALIRNDSTVTATQGAGSVIIKAEDSSTIDADLTTVAVSVAISGTAAIGLAVAATVAENTIGSNTYAGIGLVDGSTDGTVVTTDLLDIDAIGGAHIKALGIAVAFSGGGSGGVSVTGAGAGVEARNTINGTTQAQIRNSQATVNGGAVTVDADDNSQIDATLVSASVSLSLSGGASLSFAIAVTLAENVLNGTTSAVLDDADVDSATLGVTARSDADIDSEAVAVALALSGAVGFSLSGAGTGADARNELNNTVSASIIGTSDVDTTGAVTLTATESSIIDTDVVAAAASLGIAAGGAMSVAIAVSLSEVSYNTTTEAVIEDSDVTANSGNVSLTALSEGTINVDALATAVTVSAAIGLALSGSGTGVITSVVSSSETRAGIRADSNVQATTGNVILDADDTKTITTNALGVSISLTVAAGLSAGAVAAISDVDVDYDGTVQATINNSEVFAGGNIHLTADSTTTSNADATGVAIGFSAGFMAAGSFGVAAGFVDNSIGQTVDASIIGSDFASDQAVTAGGEVKLEAEDHNTMTAIARAVAVTTGVALGGGTTVGLSAAVSNIRLEGETRARIVGSKVAANGGQVFVDARTTSVLTNNPVAVAVSASVAIGGLALAGAGASGTTDVTQLVQAQIAGGSDVDASTSVTVQAFDSLTSSVDVGATAVAFGTAGGAAGIGEAKNLISTEALASIEDSSVDANGGALTIQAQSIHPDGDFFTNIDVQGIAAALFGVAVVQGIGTEDLGSVVEAFASSADLFATGVVKIDADSNHYLAPEVTGVAISSTSSVSKMVANALSTGATRAYIDGNSSVTSAGPLEVTADSIVEAHPTGASVAISLGGAGALSEFRAEITRETAAYAGTRAGETPSGLAGTIELGSKTLNLKSTATLTAVADSFGLGASLLAAGTESLSTAIVNGTTLAYVGQNQVVNAGNVNITAVSADSATAKNETVTVGIAAISAAKATSLVESRTEAFIGAFAGDQASNVTTAVNVGGGTILVDADATMTAFSESDGTNIGAVSISTYQPIATVAGATRAYVRDGVGIQAGTLDINAGESADRIKYTVTSETNGGEFSLIGTVNDLKPEAYVSGVVEAFIGASADTAGGGNPLAVITVTGGGDQVLEAWGDFEATANVDDSGGSFGVKVDAINPTAEAGGFTRAFVNDGANLPGKKLRLLADGDARAESKIDGVSLAGLAEVQLLNPLAQVSNTTEVYAGRATNEVTADAAVITVGEIDADARSKSVAIASVEGFSFGGVASISDTTVRSDASGATRAYVGKNTTLNSGPVHLMAEEIDVNPGTDGVAAMATALIDGVDAAGVAQVSTVETFATASRATEAFVGTNSTLNLGGSSLTAIADTIMTTPMARAVVDGGSGAGIANVNTMQATATIGTGTNQDQDSATRSFVGSGTTVNAGTVTLHALSNTTADAIVDSGSGAGIADISITNIFATNAHDTEAYVGDNTTLTLSGALDIKADSTVNANPKSENVSGAGLVQYGSADLKTVLDSDTTVFIGDNVTVTAPSVTMLADGDHNASANSASTGGSLAVAISDLESIVEDHGSVNARIGAATGGSGSTITTTGPGGLNVDATLFTSVKAEASAGAFSLLAGVPITTTHALNMATANGRIGDNVTIDVQQGNFDMLIDLEGVARAKSTSTAVAGVAVSDADAFAEFKAGVTFDVGTGGDIFAASNVILGARVNYDGANFQDADGGSGDGRGAIATADNVAGGLAAVTNGDVDTLAQSTMVVTIGSSNFRAGSDVTVDARHANTAFSSLANSGGGVAFVSAGNASAEAGSASDAVTPASDKPAFQISTLSFFGNVTDGMGGAGAENLNVKLETFATTDTSMDSRGGGVVSVTSDSSVLAATTNVRQDLDFATSGNVMILGSKIDVSANLITDADSKASAKTGGLVNVADIDPQAIAKGVADLTVGAATNVTAGTELLLSANQGATPSPVSDGTVTGSNANDAPGAALPGDSNSIDFDLPHLLQTGASISFASASSGGVTVGRDYTVIVVDDSQIHLGEVFEGADVNPALDTITFVGGHNLETGDIVSYHSGSGGDVINGLSNGTKYRVFKVDNNTIKLQTIGMATPSVTVDRNQIGIGGNRVDVSNSFAVNDFVTYRVPDPAKFSSALVDGVFVGNDYNNTNSNRIFIENHGFETGEAVVYHHYTVAGDGTIQNGSGTPIDIAAPGGTLNHGQTYFVIFVDGNNIRLAMTQDEATGVPDDPNTGPNEFIPVTPINIVQNTSDSAVATTHTLTSTSNSPVLTNGGVYRVSAVAGDNSWFELQDLNGNPANMFASGPFGKHTFRVESINITDSGPAGDQFLVLDITGAVSGTFDGVGGARGFAGAPSGDATVTATATGVGGGFVDVGSANAVAQHHATTSLTVNGGANLTGNLVNIASNSTIGVSALADGAGGGFAAIGSSTANASGSNTNTLTIGANAHITSLTDLNVSTGTASSVTSYAESTKGGFVAFIGGDADATLTYNVNLNVDGDLTAADQLNVVNVVSANASSDSRGYAGGLGGDGETDSFSRIGVDANNRANSRITVTDNADLLANAISLKSEVLKLAAISFAQTEVDAAGGDAEADANSSIYADNRVVLSDDLLTAPNALLTGNESISIEALYTEVVSRATADSSLDALGGGSDANATAIMNTRAFVQGFWDVELKTAELFVNALQFNLTNDAIRRGDGAVFGGFGGSATESDFHPDRWIFWESHVFLLGEPNPELEIDENGVITRLTNIEFLGVNAGKDVGDTLVASDVSNPQVIVDDIIYDEAGKVTFYANDISSDPGIIWGNRGRVESQRTWDSVRIINDSEFDLVINHIDTHDGASVVDIVVDDIPFNAASTNNVSLDPSTPGDTFEFDVNLFYPQTHVEIRNLIAGANDDSDIILLGGIENTIGRTTIENERGHIRVDERDLVHQGGRAARGDLRRGTDPHEHALCRRQRRHRQPECLGRLRHAQSAHGRVGPHHPHRQQGRAAHPQAGGSRGRCRRTTPCSTSRCTTGRRSRRSARWRSPSTRSRPATTWTWSSTTPGRATTCPTSTA